MNQENQNIENLKLRAFDICLAIYRVTKLFPEGEVLSGQLRETSSNIAVLLATKQISDTILLNIETVKIYLEIGKHQGWLNPLNFDLLIRAYCELTKAVEKTELAGESGKKKIIGTPPPLKTLIKPKFKDGWSNDEKASVQKRHELIVDYLKTNSPAKTADIVRFLGNVVDRTVRMDLKILINKKIVKKSGMNKTAMYFV